MFSFYLLLLLAHGTDNSGDAGDYSRAITVNQRRRSDLVHIPDVDLPDNGFPIIHFHGTEDQLAPYAGGRGQHPVRFRPALNRLPGPSQRMPYRTVRDGTGYRMTGVE